MSSRVTSQHLQPSLFHSLHYVKNQLLLSPGWLLGIGLLCKSFSAHALDMLWHTLPSDEQLRRLLDVLDLDVSDSETFGGELGTLCNR